MKLNKDSLWLIGQVCCVVIGVAVGLATMPAIGLAVTFAMALLVDIRGELIGLEQTTYAMAKAAHPTNSCVTPIQPLIEQWENRARCKFQSAEEKPDGATREFIEHGAMCYFNCAQELRAALASALTRAQPPPEK
jgi:hypothetical protein